MVLVDSKPRNKQLATIAEAREGKAKKEKERYKDRKKRREKLVGR